VAAASAAVEAALKASASEVFGYISTAHEQLTDVASRRKVRQHCIISCDIISLQDMLVASAVCLPSVGGANAVSAWQWHVEALRV
jgi:hypothetical protein